MSLQIIIYRGCVYGFPPQNKIDRHNITEILLKVALNTITLTHIFPSYMSSMLFAYIITFPYSLKLGTLILGVPVILWLVMLTHG